MRVTITVMTAIAAAVVAGCGSSDEPTTAEPDPVDQAAREAAAAAERIEATTTPEPPPDRDGDGVPDATDDYPDDPKRSKAPQVTLNCWRFDDHPDTDRVAIIAGDFTDAWDGEYDMCDDATRNSTPLSEVEQEALETAGYDDQETSTLYSVCAAFDPYITRATGAYAEGRIVVSPEEADEIDGALVLCPDHPLADEMAAEVERGHVDAELEESGRLFYAGTFLVGEEIQPGTYVIEGSIDDCYWERQDRNGGIIDNQFILSARRVEVTIRSTDYAFHSEGCGQWRPAD